MGWIQQLQPSAAACGLHAFLYHCLSRCCLPFDSNSSSNCRSSLAICCSCLRRCLSNSASSSSALLLLLLLLLPRKLSIPAHQQHSSNTAATHRHTAGNRANTVSTQCLYGCCRNPCTYCDGKLNNLAQISLKLRVSRHQQWVGRKRLASNGVQEGPQGNSSSSSCA